MTHSLLNSWEFMHKSGEGLREKAHSDFINSLRRIKTEPSQAMLNGREFEDLVSDYITNPLCREEMEHKWLEGAEAIADIINRDFEYGDGFTQVKSNAKVTVNNVDYLLYGVLDWLCGGIIYDIKFKENLGNYSVGNYYDNTQHRMYFELVPEADRFIYLISNGKKIYQEEYLRGESRPIYETVTEFEQWLKDYGLWNIYCENWVCKYQ
jgi:hypothetical protein